MSFLSKVLHRKPWVPFLIIANKLPDKNYPPANINAWIKQCDSLGLTNQALAIMEAWNRVVDKYPQTRINWGAATKIGTASVKKNVFGRQEFSDWLQGQLGDRVLSTDRKAEVKELNKEPSLSGVPKIAIPAKEETAEDWQAAAAKTEKTIHKVEKAFEESDMFIEALKISILEYETKIAAYGVGGPKHTTRAGEVSKLASRIPKWTRELEDLKVQLAHIEHKVNTAQNKFATVKEAYHHAPATTVAFEQKTEEMMSETLNFILGLKDPKMKQELLKKFNEMLGDKEATASVTEEITAAKAEKVWQMLKDKISDWSGKLKKLFNSLNNLESFVTLQSTR